MTKKVPKAYRVIHYNYAIQAAQIQHHTRRILLKMIFNLEKWDDFPQHKNHHISFINAKKRVKLDYFKRGETPGQQAGKGKCDGGLI